MKSLHVELTNRCTLFCPACPRTEWSDLLKRPLPKQDLDFALLDQFLNCEGGKSITDLLVCGDYGDCIYYPKLFEFLEHFRSSKTFRLCTNGSHQSDKFWHRLADLMKPGDKIIFAIDGLEDTNHLYRKNSNWSSIMTAVDIMSNSQAEVVWQTIVFSFNQHCLDQIQAFAESKGARFFSLETHRYGDPTLEPDQTQVLLHYKFKPEYNTTQIEIEPQCRVDEIIPTVGADGIFYPCDWLRNPNVFYKSQIWKQKSRWLDKLHIQNTNYDQAMVVVNDWAEYVRNNSVTGGPVDNLCKMKCRKHM